MDNMLLFVIKLLLKNIRASAVDNNEQFRQPAFGSWYSLLASDDILYDTP